MTRYLTAAALALLAAGGAQAQYMNPYGGGGYPNPYALPYNQSPFTPNIYNPANQPLSPYLNLARGGNPAVNYYYGVRPGTVGGFGNGGGAPFVASGGFRQPFFPQLAFAPDPLQPPEAGPGATLPPAGHPVGFNNTGGFFPAPTGRGRQQPGLAGVGAGRR
jgi:hypothetical protein